MPFDPVPMFHSYVRQSDEMAVLSAARALLADELRWTKHSYYECFAGGSPVYCLVGAVSMACYEHGFTEYFMLSSRLQRKVLRLLANQMHLRGGSVRHLFGAHIALATFNDRRHTDHAMVMGLFDAAIAKERHAVHA